MKIESQHLLLIILLTLTPLVTFDSVAQTSRDCKIEYPYVEKQSHPELIITEIEKVYVYTKIHFYYKNPYDSNGGVTFSKDTYLRTSKGKLYNLKSSIGIPLSPEIHYFNKKGEAINFCLIFPALPNDVKSFSIYEPCNNGFTFQNIELRSDFQGYIKKCNHMAKMFKTLENNPINKQTKISRKKLKKDPNFKIE